MATVTPNLNLELPLGTENVSRQLINSNNTKIDTFAGEVHEEFDNIGTKIQEIIDDTAGEGDTDKVWSADKSAAEVTDLKAEIDSKADPICKTIDTPASIITIEDGADDLPVKELKVAIEPVQDLHGYENPWPAGGGKNLADFVQNKGINSNGDVIDTNGRIATVNPIEIKSGENYVFKTFTTSGKAIACIYAVWNDNTLVRRVASVVDGTTLDTSGGNKLYVCAYENTSGGTTTIEEAQAMIYRSSDVATAYEPYSNICPITGWTGCNVTRTGKNLLNKNAATAIVTPDGNTRNGMYVPLKAGTYTLSCANATSGPYYRIKDGNAEWGSAVKLSDGTSATFTLVNDGELCLNTASGTAFSATGDLQLEFGSEATTYEPFGAVYPIAFPSEAGTVYGGELTLHADGTGELVVDKERVVLTGNENTRWQSSKVLLFAISGYLPRTTANYKEYLSDRYQGTATGWSQIEPMQFQYVEGYLGIYDPVHMPDAATGAAYVQGLYSAGTPLEFVLPLQTPVTYTLTAPQVRTLLGLNHIFASTGNIESIMYPVDTAMALDNQTTTTHDMIAGSDSTVATESHAVGDVFICNNKLYKATDAIAVGENIIEGSNVIQTSVAELIVKGPRFVCNFGLSKNEYVELQMTGVARAVAFVSGASAGRNGMIHVFSNESSVYAESATSFNNISVSYNNTDRTVKIQNTGNDDIYVDVLKFYGDIKGTWVMPLGI